MILSRKALDQYGRERNLSAIDHGLRGIGQAGGIMAQSRAAEEAAALNRRRMALQEEESARAGTVLDLQLAKAQGWTGQPDAPSRPMSPADISREQNELGPARVVMPRPKPSAPAERFGGIDPAGINRLRNMPEIQPSPRPTADGMIRGQIASRVDTMRTDADFARSEEFLAKNHPDMLAYFRSTAAEKGLSRAEQAAMIKDIAAVAGPVENAEKQGIEFAKIKETGDIARKNMLAEISARDRARGKNSRLEELGRQAQEARKNGDLGAVARFEAEAEALDPGGIRYPRPPSMVVQPGLDQRDAQSQIRSISQIANNRTGLLLPNEFVSLWRAMETRDGKSYEPEEVEQMTGFKLLRGRGEVAEGGGE